MGILQTLKIKGPDTPGGSAAAPAKGKGPNLTSRKGKTAGPAAPLHDRRRRLVHAREVILRDLGGLMLEMYKRNRFREELLLDKCEEVLAVEVEIAHVDQRLFQMTPPNAAGQRPIGRCECGSPILPGQNFCGVCGRSFTTLSQTKPCERCGNGLRPGDGFCSRCGTPAPDDLAPLEIVAPPIEVVNTQPAPTVTQAPATSTTPSASDQGTVSLKATVEDTQPIQTTPHEPIILGPATPPEPEPKKQTKPSSSASKPAASTTSGSPSTAAAAASSSKSSGETMSEKDARKAIADHSKERQRLQKAKAKAAKERAKARARAAKQAKKRGE
jgi:hypothetical protein